MNLYHIILGATPKKRLIEQHDVFFLIAENLKEVVVYIDEFWPECEGKFHIDSFEKIEFVENYKITVVPKQKTTTEDKLFYINLGGYLPNDMEEYHYKELVVAKNKTEAIKKVKETAFYKKFSFKGAESHIDDQYGVDIDDIFKIEDILLPVFKRNYCLLIEKSENPEKNFKRIGYLSLSKLEKTDF